MVKTIVICTIYFQYYDKLSYYLDRKFTMKLKIILINFQNALLYNKYESIRFPYYIQIVQKTKYFSVDYV